MVAVGLEINANHLRSVRSGTVTATATPIFQGRTTEVWSIEIKDEAGKLVCVSRCTLAVIAPPSAAKRAASGFRVVAVARRLQVVERGVASLEGQQLGVAARFLHLAAVEHDDLVGQPHRREAVRDQERDALAGLLAQRLDGVELGAGVERRGRFVEHQHRGVAEVQASPAPGAATARPTVAARPETAVPAGS